MKTLFAFLLMASTCFGAEIKSVRSVPGKVIFDATIKNKEVVEIDKYYVIGNTTYIDLKSSGGGKKTVDKTYGVQCTTHHAKIRFSGQYQDVYVKQLYCSSQLDFIGWDFYGRPVYLPIKRCYEQ